MGLVTPTKDRVWAIVSAVAALAIVLVVSACGSGSSSYTIEASSMEPTLHCAKPGYGCEADAADKIVVDSTTAFKRTDIVLFDRPQSAQAKCGASGKSASRLIGLPGDAVEMRLRNDGHGYVYVNGEALAEWYVSDLNRSSEPYGPFTVPDGSYFVLGDNRPVSCDSRVWGTVPAENIIGTVTKIIHPS